MKNFTKPSDSIIKQLVWITAVLVILFSFSSLNDVIAQASSDDTEVNIYMFWGEGCPHCAEAKPVLEEIAAADDRIEYYDFEVYEDEENLALFFEMSEAYGVSPQGVPTMFAGEQYWIGYSENIKAEIESYIDYCLENGCDDPGKALVEPTNPSATGTPVVEATSTPEGSPTIAPTTTDNDKSSGGQKNDTISLPLIGTIDLANQSILFSTLLISFVDGFNPCSIWVLSMLLAITLNTRSRKKVLIIGFVFIFVTGLIYALFIAGLFTVLKVVRFLGWIQVVVALVALVFGLINIKDYFWFKKGVSLTISDEKKPGIYKGIRRVVNASESIWGMIAGTAILAAGVSLIEFSCTAGFPVLWTNLLNAQEISGMAFLGFLLVYMLVYQIDELGIFLVSVFSLRQAKMEEKHGRMLKLLGGILMLSLAAVMLIDPTIMNSLKNALLVFAAAFALTGLILLVHQVILPKLTKTSTKKRPSG